MCLSILDIVVLQWHWVNLFLIYIFAICFGTWHANSEKEKLLHGLPNLLLQPHFMHKFSFSFAFESFLQLVVEHIELLFQFEYFVFIEFKSNNIIFILFIFLHIPTE